MSDATPPVDDAPNFEQEMEKMISDRSRYEYERLDMNVRQLMANMTLSQDWPRDKSLIDVPVMRKMASVYIRDVFCGKAKMKPFVVNDIRDRKCLIHGARRLQALHLFINFEIPMKLYNGYYVFLDKMEKDMQDAFFQAPLTLFRLHNVPRAELKLLPQQPMDEFEDIGDACESVREDIQSSQ